MKKILMYAWLPLVVFGCAALLEPIDPVTAPAGTPTETTAQPIEVPVDADGDGTPEATATITPNAGPRPTTQADVLVDGASGVVGMLTGNAPLAYMLSQLGRLAIGALVRRKKKQPAVVAAGATT